MTRKLLLTAILVSGVLARVDDACAMPIHNFTRMDDDDDATYVTLMVEGAAKHLREEGLTAQADKTVAFFKQTGSRGGVAQFAGNLRALDSLNNRNAINPNNRVPEYEVEDAMALTLKNNNIVVPVAYLQSVTQTFSPSGPPRTFAPTPSFTP